MSIQLKELYALQGSHISACATSPAPNQLCRARHSDLQRPSNRWHQQLRPWFSAAPLGLLLSQDTLTLNLLRTSRINPRISAEAKLNGAFNFNLTPLAPSGTKALIFESSTNRRTWAPHGVEGWYLGPDPEHYCYYQLYVLNTRAKCTANTV